MKNIDNFLVHLNNFENESSIAARYLFAEMAIQHGASKSKSLLKKLNETPTFWIVCNASLQSSTYISIGRIFDKTSKYNIDELLISMEKNLHSFQLEALANRKRDGKTEDPEWLKDYLKHAHVPIYKDIERLRNMVAKYRLIYERAIKPPRNKYLAHREKEDRVEVQALYAGGTIRELARLTTFLLKLHNALWQQYYNGKKPTLRSLRHSVKSIYDAERQRSSPHELIVSDVKKLMQFIETATPKHA